jgi:uncharacterized protein YbaP (TraB family)
MSRFKPFYLSMVIMQELIGESMSYEIEFKKLAKKNNMSTSGLETIQFQMNLMSESSNEEQIKMLLLGLTKDKTVYNNLLNAYLKRDINQLGVLMNNADVVPDFYSNFIVKRNQKWIPIISELIQKKINVYCSWSWPPVRKRGSLEFIERSGLYS